MMKGVRKIKEKIVGGNRSSSAKAQKSNPALGLRLKVSGKIICLKPQTSNLKHLWWGLASQSLLKFLSQQGKHGEKVAHDPVRCKLKNGSLRVFVNGDNNIRGLHPSLMLNRT